MAGSLTDMEQKILAAALDRSMIRGAELPSYANTTDWKKLADAVQKLASNKLIEVSGDVWNVRELPYATIGVLPSAREYLHGVVRTKSF